MGGQGSGRPPNVETLLRKPEVKTPIGDDFFIPNYSGLQAVKKTDPTVIPSAETDPIFMSLSGSLGYVSSESDPVFMALSGSFLTAETDPVFMALSGSFLLNTGDTATGNYTFDTDTLFIDATNDRVGIGTVSPGAKLHVVGAISGSSIYTTGAITGGGSGHDQFSDFVTNEHLDWTADQGANNINNANITGLPIANTALVAGTNITLSTNTLNVDDAFIKNNANDTTTGSVATTADFTASGSAIFRNVLIGTEASPGAASGWPQGTLYVQYTA